VPCYNYARLLRECVESVLSQTNVDVRLLIIDDASTDNTSDVAAQLAAQDSRVECRRHSNNLGHIATYNEGLAWASGDYLVLLSADDMLTPGSLSRASSLLDSHPEVGMVYGRCVLFESGNSLPPYHNPLGLGAHHIYDGLDWLELACKRGKTWVASPEVVVRTDLQHRLGGYLPELPHSGDNEMWMRFAVHASVGKLLEADQAYYRIHSNSMTSRLFSTEAKDIDQRKLAFERIFRDYRNLIPNWQRLKKRADRSLATDALWAIIKAGWRKDKTRASAGELWRIANFGQHSSWLAWDMLHVYSGVCRRFLRLAYMKTRLLLTRQGFT